MCNAFITRQEFLKTQRLAAKQKNVHAFAVGTLVAKFKIKELLKITYNPYVHDFFVEVESGKEVHKSLRCVLNKDGCFITKLIA